MKKRETVVDIIKESFYFLWTIFVELLQNSWILRFSLLLIFIQMVTFFLSGGPDGENHKTIFYASGFLLTLIVSVFGYLRFIIAFTLDALKNSEKEES